MGNELQPAISMLQKRLDEQLRAVAETKQAINMLLKLSGKSPLFVEESGTSGMIRADQFYGKQLATAVAEYLESMGRQARQASEILQGLRDGGFDFDVMGWRSNDELRMLALSLAKNNTKFHKLKNGSFGLKSWYDDEFLKKSAAKKAASAASADEQKDGSPVEEAGTTPPRYAPKVGDYVQWEPNGVLQFESPKKITRISDDGEFAFVVGHKTGLPVGELLLERTPVVIEDSAE